MTPPMAEALEGLIERLEEDAVYLRDVWPSRPITDGRIHPVDGRMLDKSAARMLEAAQALRLLGEAERAMEEIADGKLPPEKEGHYLAHRKGVSIARAALDKIRKGMGR